MCKEDWTEFGQDYANVYTKTLLILQYVLPVSVLIFTYTSIGIVIWCHRIPGEAEDGRDLRIARSKRKMIKMMVAVVLVYTICWLPLNIYLVMREMGVDIVHEEIVWLASHLLAMSHPCYNPVIYCYMNNRFRQGFMQIFGIVLPCCRSACSRAAMMNNNGRSRMSIPLTSIGGTDSTILHRNNTCTTYISTRRRTGNSLVGGAGTNGTPNLRLHHRPTRIQFSETVNVNNPNGHTPAAVGGEETSQSNNYSTGMPPVRSLSVMSRQSANNSENESQHLITRKSSHKKEKNDKKAKNSYNFNDLSETEFHNCQKVNLLN
ncbi:RYamide receptor isoform X3 [Atheta coriaria]